MVACGLGVALVPESATRPGQAPDRSTRVIPLEQSATIELAAVWRRETSALVDGFLSSAREALGTG